MSKTTLRNLIDGPYPLAGIQGAATPAVKPAKGKASPLAQHVASHLTDPVGSTQDTFNDLSQKKLDYKQAQDNAKLQLAPVKSFIEQAEQQHELNDDANMGYQDPNDPNAQMMPGMPGQMPGMKPGMPQQAQPGMPGTNPKANMPGNGPMLQPGRSPAPAESVRPQKMGQAQPGQSSPAANPSAPKASPKKVSQKKPGGAAGRSIKVHVAANAGSQPITRTKLDAAIVNASFNWTASGLCKHGKKKEDCPLCAGK